MSFINERNASAVKCQSMKKKPSIFLPCKKGSLQLQVDCRYRIVYDTMCNFDWLISQYLCTLEFGKFYFLLPVMPENRIWSNLTRNEFSWKLFSASTQRRMSIAATIEAIHARSRFFLEWQSRTFQCQDTRLPGRQEVLRKQFCFVKIHI